MQEVYLQKGGKMKINVFMIQCQLGSKVKYKNQEKTVVDINRRTKEVCIGNGKHSWIRCTEVELINHSK